MEASTHPTGAGSIVFIDDEKPVLDAYRRTLRKRRVGWETHFFERPAEALGRLQDLGVHVVVVDMYMPGMSGLQMLDRVKSEPSTADLPVIIVTGSGEDELKTRALEAGATDLLQKPVNAEVMCARIRNALRLKEHSDLLRSQQAILNRRVEEQTAEISQSRMEIIWRLAKAAEARDDDTGRHVIRVGLYSKIIAESFGADIDLVNRISPAACLHDVGKIGISDSLLQKPGRLTAAEHEEIQKHCEIGHRILSQRVDPALLGDHSEPESVSRGGADPTLELAADIALCHHERWDGAGYPNRLRGETIPLAARITAVADVYDALRSKRAYKRERSVRDTLQIMDREAGAHFDPGVYEAFLSEIDRIIDVERAHSDAAQSA